MPAESLLLSRSDISRNKMLISVGDRNDVGVAGLNRTAVERLTAARQALRGTE